MAPNESQTSRDARAPVSSTNGTSDWPGWPAVVPNARPPTNAEMNPLPPSAPADAYAHAARPSTAGPAKPSATQPRRRAPLTSMPPAPPTARPIRMPKPSSAAGGGPPPAEPEKNAEAELGGGRGRPVLGDLASHRRSGQRDRHEGRGDPVVESA